MTKLVEHFEHFADIASKHIGGLWAFMLALMIIASWAYSQNDVFDKLIDVATFLFVFIIQNNQNRSGKAIQLKLDEIIRVHAKASNSIIDIEDSSEDQLEKVHGKIQKEARAAPENPATHTQ